MNWALLIIGVCLIIMGCYAWIHPRFLEGLRNWAVGAAPGTVLFGVSTVLFTVNLLVVDAYGLHHAFDRWWFQPIHQAVLDGLLRPSMLLFFIGILVFFWGYPDRTHLSELISRLRHPERRRQALGQTFQAIAAIVTTVASASALIAIPRFVSVGTWGSTLIGVAAIPVALFVGILVYRWRERLVQKYEE